MIAGAVYICREANVCRLLSSSSCLWDIFLQQRGRDERFLSTKTAISPSVTFAGRAVYDCIPNLGIHTCKVLFQGHTSRQPCPLIKALPHCTFLHDHVLGLKSLGVRLIRKQLYDISILFTFTHPPTPTHTHPHITTHPHTQPHTHPHTHTPTHQTHTPTTTHFQFLFHFLLCPQSGNLGSPFRSHVLQALSLRGCAGHWGGGGEDRWILGGEGSCMKGVNEREV